MWAEFTIIPSQLLFVLNHASNAAPGISRSFDRFLCQWLIHHSGLFWNISTSIGLIAIKCCRGVYGPQMRNQSNNCDPLTFPLAPWRSFLVFSISTSTGWAFIVPRGWTLPTLSICLCQQCKQQPVFNHPIQYHNIYLMYLHSFTSMFPSWWTLIN